MGKFHRRDENRWSRRIHKICALGENVKQSNWGSFNTTRFPQTRMGVEQVFYDVL